ncbi:MAG: stage V sporulation T C-terminal domain-containing protein [Oscillospiraceae bacterium]|nr:stage V sporulation T C-terminal domain-containing protein [Oscillospiraceae bacterium]
MKATGIVRRIDDLGRVVIPKEIRRTLRIREGDPLEIFTDADGVVVFKKYSPIGELSDFAGQYAEVLHKTSSLPALICDCDHVVAAAGVPRKEYVGRRITPEIEEYMQSRARFVSGSGQREVNPVEGIDQQAGVICPIIASSDVTGAVVLLKEEDRQQPGETETKLTQAAAAFLGKQLET